MLVLSRKTGEKLYVGEDVVIEVRRVSGCRVSIAIEAPREVKILRGELFEAVTEFEEPADRSNELTVTPTSGDVHGCESVHDSAQVKPYLVSHPPMNPPGMVPGW